MMKKTNCSDSIFSVGDDHQREIERQNRITEQILTNFFERKFFPNRRPAQKVPTIEEILPLPTDSTEPLSPRNKHSAKHPEDEDDFREQDDLFFNRDSDNLQTVESEHVDKVYGHDYSEGRWSLGIYFFAYSRSSIKN